MKKITASLYFLFALFIGANLLSCSSSKSTSGSMSVNQVVMTDMKFAPESITISVGSTVSWHNLENKTHTATANDGSWDTGDMGLGASKSIKFDKPGTYKYHCTHHSVLGIGMSGTVIVE